MSRQIGRADPHDKMTFSPAQTKQTFLLRVWRNAVSDAWHYTVVIPNVEKRHHFHSIMDAAQFIDSLMRC